ncbi:MAG: DUF2318 domain-containing protein [Eubacterium sp.]
MAKSKKNIVLPIAAAVIVLIAVITVVVPKLTGNDDQITEEAQATQAQQTTQSTVPEVQTSGGDIEIDTNSVNETAKFYDYNANGTTVELFAVKASDGTIRLALNTCQVCMGSPFAFFVQQGDSFICQNCKNVFALDSIGTVHGGCNPVPITQDNYEIQDEKIIVSGEFLNQYAPNFANWKKF